MTPNGVIILMELKTIRTNKTQRKALVLNRIAKLKAYRNNYAHFKRALRQHNNKITDYDLKEYTTKAGKTYNHPYIKTQNGNFVIGQRNWFRA